MSDLRTKVNTDSLAWACVALSALCFLGVLVSIGLYAYRGEVLLARMEVSVGEVLMNTGKRLEEGGFSGEAVAQYRVALRARYQGEQNRIQTLERLGGLLVAGGALEEALPLLREAADSEHARVTVYASLVEALFQSEAFEEAGDVSARWLAMAAEEGDVLQEAAAHFQLGRVAQATQRAEEAFVGHYLQSSRMTPGGDAAWALAQHYASKGRHDEAREQVEAFLLYGATGDARSAAEDFVL